MIATACCHPCYPKDFFRTCNVLPFSCTHLALWRGKVKTQGTWKTERIQEFLYATPNSLVISNPAMVPAVWNRKFPYHVQDHCFQSRNKSGYSESLEHRYLVPYSFLLSVAQPNVHLINQTLRRKIIAGLAKNFIIWTTIIKKLCIRSKINFRSILLCVARAYVIWLCVVQIKESSGSSGKKKKDFKLALRELKMAKQLDICSPTTYLIGFFLDWQSFIVSNYAYSCLWTYSMSWQKLDKS